MAIVITVKSWIYYLTSSSSKSEGFAVLSDEDLAKISSKREPVPTDQEAVEAHQTLLRFIRNDFTKGIKFVYDFGERFYGPERPSLRKDLDVRMLMDNYQNPLQRL